MRAIALSSCWPTMRVLEPLWRRSDAGGSRWRRARRGRRPGERRERRPVGAASAQGVGLAFFLTSAGRCLRERRAIAEPGVLAALYAPGPCREFIPLLVGSQATWNGSAFDQSRGIVVDGFAGAERVVRRSCRRRG
jgi:hypothetical protein